MICPLMSNNFEHKGLSNNVACYKEECAWWNRESEKCIVHALDEIASNISDIYYGVIKDE